MDSNILTLELPEEDESKPVSASPESPAQNAPKMILVTGGSGYLALHILEQLSKEGHKLRTTVRDLNETLKIEAINRATKASKWPIEIILADLNEPETWKDTCSNCDIVMHVAAPCPKGRTIEDGMKFVLLRQIDF